MSVLLHTSPLVGATVNPELTGARRLREWLADGRAEPQVSKPLDLHYLRTRYGPEQAARPRLISAFFRVPLGTRWATYEARKKTVIGQWLDRMRKSGWDWTGQTITVRPGMYPAHDLDGVPILDSHEFEVRTSFSKRSPQVLRLEIRPEWLATVRGGAT